MPSYASLLRWSKSYGLFKRARRRLGHSPGVQIAEHRYQVLEVRSLPINVLWVCVGVFMTRLKLRMRVRLSQAGEPRQIN